MAHLRIHLALLVALWATQGASAQTITDISRASLSPGDNKQGESYSYDPEMDGAGRYVVFTSTADSFAADGKVTGEYHEHVYLRDVVSGTTTQLDVTAEGKTGSPSSAFNANVRTFGSSFDPHISRDGKYVVFLSSQRDLSEDKPSQYHWAYRKNLETGVIEKLPHAHEGDDAYVEYPAYLAINADGSVVVIMSIVSGVGDNSCESCPWELTVYRQATGVTTQIATGVTGNKFNPGISDDGRYVVFENQPGDFSAPTYSYLYDLQDEVLTPLGGGAAADSPAISGDGRYIVYSDTSSVPTKLKLLERGTANESVIPELSGGETQDGISEFASLSQDGRYIGFLSTASNLVTNDTNGTDDIFIYDQVKKKTTLVSVQGTCTGISTQEDFNTGPPTISSDGSRIVFTVLERLLAADKVSSAGRTIEPADTNRFDDVYVTDLNYDDAPDVFRTNLTPTSPLVSVNCTGVQARIQTESVVATPNRARRFSSAAVKSITQEVVIRKQRSNGGLAEVVKKVTTKRNLITTGGLRNGRYAAQVRAVATLKNGTTKRSKYSKASKFTIARSS